MGVPVVKGPELDGVAETTRENFSVDSAQECVDVREYLSKVKPDILMNYLPVGSEDAVRFYADLCIELGIAFVNAIPVFIASDRVWAKRFEEKNVPIIGDDIKSQLGATIVHRTLTKLFMDRGVKLDNTYQLNVGGNTDFQNMLDRSRLKSKKISKTQSVQSQMIEKLPDGEIHIGPSDHIPWLNDKKLCFIRMEGRKFGDIPINIELRLEVEDSPNSAGVMVDAIRCAKIALDRGIGGALLSPSSYFMKSPPEQYSDSEAKQRVEEFICGNRRV